jgi:asparagine synthase (glutamine-hydrolysing)
MCGIVGILNSNNRPVVSEVLEKMTDAVAHRGPDDQGQYVDGAAGLGHRRLSIIDVSAAGHQPMLSADGRYAIAYNGEVYNFRELRAELEAAGRTFFSQTDTEVVLQAVAEWGAAAVSRFNGMFAFAVWDSREQTLLLARDRYGIKPLYFSFQDGTFLFASEIKALRRHPAFRTDLDREALLEYFTFQNLFTDRTLFQGVKLMPAGCTARLKPGDAALRAERFWDYRFQEPVMPADDQEYLEELDRLFRQAVKRQLVSDVEVGAYLSGGMDSGAITAIAASQLPYLKTFTCGFDMRSASGIEFGSDEREKAEYMSYLFKTEHYEMVLKAGDLERCMTELTWHLEDPRVGQCYPNFYVSRLATKFVKVCLAGTGGDELFGGYPWRYYRAVVNDDFEHYIDKYYRYWQRLLSNSEIKQVFAPIWGDVKQVWTRDIFRDVFPPELRHLTSPEDYVNHSLYFEAKTFLHGLLLVEDKLSMAHSLETRPIFLDNDLVDFALRVPVRLKLGSLQEVVGINENELGKLRKYFEKTRDGKLLLRKAMMRHIPGEITGAIKQGFSAPDSSWFRGESIEFVKRRLYSRQARIYEFLDYSSVVALLDRHMGGQENRRLLIWSLLLFEQWCETFLNGKSS